MINPLQGGAQNMTAIAKSLPDEQIKTRQFGVLALLALVVLFAQTLAASARGVPESFADLSERLLPAVVMAVVRR